MSFEGVLIAGCLLSAGEALVAYHQETMPTLKALAVCIFSGSVILFWGVVLCVLLGLPLR